jgi:uncharacterized protein YndB with AHSA1/START domain
LTDPIARRNSSLGLRLELTRVLPAARPVVFEAFSAPDKLAQWWGPAGFSTPSLDFLVRAGERYRIEMQPPQGERFLLTGEFRRVDPPARVVFTFVWDDPDPDDVETVVDLSFRDLGAWTDVALRHGPFRTEARRMLHHDGWTESFDKLERLLSDEA